MKSKLSQDKILKIVNSADQPLHTMEVARHFPHISDFRIKNTLIRLQVSGKISGRCLDVAKGVWIWWRKNLLKK